MYAITRLHAHHARRRLTPSPPLQRLNWWPSSLGGGASYFVFWALSLTAGFALHHFDLDGFGDRTRSRSRKGDGEQVWDWERKTIWVLLAFATMALPALACFAKLRADRRNSYRRSLTPAQKTCVPLPLARSDLLLATSG